MGFHINLGSGWVLGIFLINPYSRKLQALISGLKDFVEGLGLRHKG